MLDKSKGVFHYLTYICLLAAFVLLCSTIWKTISSSSLTRKNFWFLKHNDLTPEKIAQEKDMLIGISKMVKSYEEHMPECLPKEMWLINGSNPSNYSLGCKPKNIFVNYFTPEVLDSWGMPYLYNRKAGTISSSGPNKKFDTLSNGVSVDDLIYSYRPKLRVMLTEMNLQRTHIRIYLSKGILNSHINTYNMAILNGKKENMIVPIEELTVGNNLNISIVEIRLNQPLMMGNQYFVKFCKRLALSDGTFLPKNFSTKIELKQTKQQNKEALKATSGE